MGKIPAKMQEFFFLIGRREVMGLKKMYICRLFLKMARTSLNTCIFTGFCAKRASRIPRAPTGFLRNCPGKHDAHPETVHHFPALQPAVLHSTFILAICKFSSDWFPALWQEFGTELQLAVLLQAVRFFEQLL